MGKDGKDRQAIYKQRLKDSGMDMVKFPLEREHIEEAQRLFGMNGKQQALHDALVLGLTGKQDTAQIHLMDLEREVMLKKLDAIKALAAAARADIAKAANNPQTKNNDPAKIPTWKNLHKFLEQLDGVLNNE
jgi:predicted O-linked N-acetylglucosamine transferase (SPINDLY family)